MTPWERMTTAIDLLAIDPAGLGGIAIQARVGPARNAALQAVAEMFPNQRRLHPGMSLEDLEGGIDLTSTLSNGGLVQHEGLLAASDTTLILPMAERVGSQLAGVLAESLELRPNQTLIALDEGADEDERMAQPLSDRLALQVCLDGVAHSETVTAPNANHDTIPLSSVDFDDGLPEVLVTLAVKLGISSLRAPIQALRAAKAHAALNGRALVGAEDVAAAVALVYASRATQIPAENEPQEPQQSEDRSEPESKRQEQLEIPEEMLLEAIKTALPADLLAKLNAGTNRQGTGSGSGKKRVGNRRGRPLPARNARAKAGARIDLMATLRAAIPWQTVRKIAQPERTGAVVLPADLRAKRYQELSDRLLIFTVDASGSAALARLGEAKGAVELLLAEAYARRDHVALVSFRGTGAEVLLPPTRSLVQTKRRLADLPGGGGTPTAAGLVAAMTMARTAAQKGLTPTVVLLTDGRSNVALNETTDRVLAGKDASEMASALALQGIDAIVIDTGNRPSPALCELASTMHAPYIALPRADARKLSDAVTTTLEA